MRYEYRKEFEISYSNLNRAARLSVPEAFSMIQVMTTEFLEGLGSDNVRMREEAGALWVILKSKLHILRMPDWKETLQARSFFTVCRGVRIEITTVFSVGEETVFLAKQELCAIDAQSRRIRKLNTLAFPQDTETEPAVLTLPYGRLKDTFEGEKPVMEDRFRMCDVDYSGHINNIVYIRMMLNTFTWEFLEQRGIRDFEIHYLHECTENHACQMYRKDEENSCSLMIRSGEEKAVAARLEFTRSEESETQSKSKCLK